jgi:hypothetical protein
VFSRSCSGPHPVSTPEVDKKLEQKAGVRPPLQQGDEGDEFLLAANADSAASD